MHARLLLFHLPERVAVLARLWDAVAPGGHLVVQDYDVRAISVLPELASVEEIGRVLTGAFTAAGADVSAGARLPRLFAQAGVGEPDGTDVAGRLEPFATGRVLLESVLPQRAAGARWPTASPPRPTPQRSLSALDRDAAQFPDRPMLWPLHDRRLEAQRSSVTALIERILSLEHRRPSSTRCRLREAAGWGRRSAASTPV